jgi:hypothetical protein
VKALGPAGIDADAVVTDAIEAVCDASAKRPEQAAVAAAKAARTQTVGTLWRRVSGRSAERWALREKSRLSPGPGVNCKASRSRSPWE